MPVPTLETNLQKPEVWGLAYLYMYNGPIIQLAITVNGNSLLQIATFSPDLSLQLVIWGITNCLTKGWVQLLIDRALSRQTFTIPQPL